jgi:hypothetical protein
MIRPPHALLRLAACAALLSPLLGHAALFEDDEARRAILELRQKVDAQRAAGDKQDADLRAENEQLRRGLLDLQNQIETLRGEVAATRGQNEQITRAVTELQQPGRRGSAAPDGAHQGQRGRTRVRRDTGRATRLRCRAGGVPQG